MSDIISYADQTLESRALNTNYIQNDEARLHLDTSSGVMLVKQLSDSQVSAGIADAFGKFGSFTEAGLYKYSNTDWWVSAKSTNGNWYYATNQWFLEFGTDTWYFLDSNGYPLRNRWAYLTVSSLKDWTDPSNCGWFFFDENGHMARGWKNIEGKWYYFRRELLSDGSDFTGECIYLDVDPFILESNNNVSHNGKTVKFVKGFTLTAYDYYSDISGTYPSTPSHIRSQAIYLNNSTTLNEAFAAGSISAIAPTGYSLDTNKNFSSTFHSNISLVNNDSFSILASQTKVHFYYKPNTYTVSFDANGGINGPLSSVNIIYGSSSYYSYGDIVPSRPGYTFKGFYSSPKDGIQVYNAHGVCTNDGTYWKNYSWIYPDHVTLYAHWEVNPYTITYDANGGTTNAASDTYYYNDEVSLSPSASKPGYRFVGWSTSPSASKPLTSFYMPDLATSSNIEYSSDWELTLYALYSIDVSDISNHDYPKYNKVNTNEVQLMVWKLNEPEHPVIYPLCYKSDAGIMYYTYELETTNLSSSIGDSDYEYQIIAYDNAGNNSILLYDTHIIPVPVNYWQKVEHYKYDKAFDQWVYFDTTSDRVQEGTTYTPSYITAPEGYQTDHIDASYTVTTAQTSNAYYTPLTYTLYFNPNGGTVSPTSKNIQYSEYYGEMPTPVRTGYSFTGWFTKETDGTEVFDKDIYTTNGNSTLFAHWSANSYNVIYDYWTNGGTSVTKKTDSVVYNTDIDLSVSAAKTGWTFVGWNTNPNASIGLPSLKISDDDIILYAIYKKDITATFIDGNNKNTNKIIKTIYNNDTSCTITTRPITKLDGWKIRGWSTSTEGNASIHVSPNIELILDSDKTFYACYEQTITITYNTNGSSQHISPQTGIRYFNASNTYHNPSFITAKAPSLEKHSFVYWEEYENGVATKYYPAQTEIIADHNFTLKAKWDSYPELEAYDRYFTLEDAKCGKITQQRLFEKVTATDKEDGILTNGIDVIIKNWETYDFSNQASVAITYQAKDSFGNLLEKTITVFIVDTAISQSPLSYHARFISSDFYESDGALLSEENGGLASTSTWRTNSTYQQLLEDVLSADTPKQSFSFSNEDLKQRNIE